MRATTTLLHYSHTMTMVRLLSNLRTCLCMCLLCIIRMDVTCAASLWDIIASYSENYDIDGLHEYLTTGFEASERQIDPAKRQIPLAPDYTTRGAGFDMTFRHKLVHDLEQLEFLCQHEMNSNPDPFLKDTIPQTYQEILDQFYNIYNTYEEEEEEEDDEIIVTKDDPYTFHQTDAALDWYNRALFVPPCHERTGMFGKETKDKSILNENLDFAKVERQWFGEEPDHEHPGVVVIDK